MSNSADLRVRPPGFELFSAPLRVAFDPNTFERVEFAYIAAKFGHYGQKRRDGRRYFDHPKEAAWIYIDELGGRDPEVIIDILLHDLPEDSYLLSIYRIKLNFGIDRALDAQALKKLPKGKESTVQYLGRIVIRGPRTILAKLCDRCSNLRDMKSSSKNDRQRQLVETEEYHLPILIPALREHGGEWAQYADLMEQKIKDALNSLR